MTALEHLDTLLADPGRQTVLPRDLQGSRSEAHRALRRRGNDGTLVRIGRSVYARRQARLFDVVSGGIRPTLRRQPTLPSFRDLPRRRAVLAGQPSGAALFRMRCNFREATGDRLVGSTGHGLMQPRRAARR